MFIFVVVVVVVLVGSSSGCRRRNLVVRVEREGATFAAVNPEAPNCGADSDFQSLRPGHAKDLPRTGVGCPMSLGLGGSTEKSLFRLASKLVEWLGTVGARHCAIVPTRISDLRLAKMSWNPTRF